MPCWGGLQDAVETLYKLGFKAPLDYQCDDFGTISPFKEIADAQNKATGADKTIFDGVAFNY